MKKEFLSFLLALVMIFSLVPTVAFATTELAPEDPRGRENEDDYLTFTATGGAVTIELKKSLEWAPTLNLEYQTKGAIDFQWPAGNWTTYGAIERDRELCTLNTGESIRLRAPLEKSNDSMSKENAEWRFVMSGTGQVEASGDITSLLDGMNTVSKLQNSAFRNTFYNCTSLISAPKLPSKILADNCYGGMFSGCTSLTTAPELPATTLAKNCYKEMFKGCTALATAPALSATILADYCYAEMFFSCTSLTTVLALPATTLAENCYKDMFNGCIALTTAPAFSATTLADYCYVGMFFGCKSLKIVPALPATTLAKNCYKDMFNGCTELKTAPELPAEELQSGCYWNMFSGCTSLTTAPKLPATTLADNCYASMFSGCTSLTTAPKLPATSLNSGCYYSMFSGCTSLTKAPALPATELKDNCYNSMFNGCTSLSSILVGFTTLGGVTNPTKDWLKGVASPAFKFYCSPDLPNDSTCIPTGCEKINIELSPSAAELSIGESIYVTVSPDAIEGPVLEYLKFDVADETIVTVSGINVAGLTHGATTITASSFGTKITFAALVNDEKATHSVIYLDKGGSVFSGTHEAGHPTKHTYGTATDLKGASKDGYTFGGWFTTSDCSGASIETLAATAYFNDITLYAKWIAKKYTVTLNPVGGTGGTTSVAAIFDAAMPAATMPEKTGYTFNGYFDAETDGTKYYDSNGSSVKNWDKATDTSLYAQWSEIPAPPAPSYDSGSSSSTVTIPVTGDENTVKVSATVSGSTATVKRIKDAELAKLTNGESVSIDLSAAGKNVDTAKIPTETVEKIAEKSSMTVKLPVAAVEFDKTATEEIVDQAKGRNIELVVDDIKEVSLNAVQKEAAKKLDTAIIIDAYLASNGSRLCTAENGGFGGGKAKVILPYEIKNNRKPENYSVFYVNEAGSLEKLNAAYDEELKAFVFEIEHFSVYAVAFEQFVDIDTNAYYYDAVKWAAENGVTDGIDDTHFDPNGITNRAQMVTFLWKAAGRPEPTISETPFTDLNPDGYYFKAVLWAYENGITDGATATTFEPDKNVSRAQTVTFLWRYAGKPVLDYWMQMTDVASGQYYTEAVRWALAESITDGTSKTTFSPNDDCLRDQIVTFLYRSLVK